MNKIDELPAGNPTNNSTIDMDDVIGKRDILMICLDTLRYDVAKQEEFNGGTPILNKFTKWEKRHAPGNFTYPSHFAIFAGFFPSPAEPHDLHNRKWLFFPKGAGTGNIAPQGSYMFKEATFVESLHKNENYETICIGGVGFFSKRNDIGRVFPGYFNKSYWKPTFGCPDKDSATNQVDFAIEKLENYSADKRIFMYINFSAIHYPNKHYVDGKKTDDKESHAAALQYVDRELERLFDAFGKRGEPLVIAFSDHGTCYGEDGYNYHCISHDSVYVVPYKNFILKK